MLPSHILNVESSPEVPIQPLHRSSDSTLHQCPSMSPFNTKRLRQYLVCVHVRTFRIGDWLCTTVSWMCDFVSIHVDWRVTDSHSSLWGGRSICWLCRLIFFLLFFIFYFLQSEGTRWIFAAWLQPVMSLLPLASAFAHAVLLCVIFFMCVSLYSNIPADFHVYILLWMACKVGFVCACLHFRVYSGLRRRR